MLRGLVLALVLLVPLAFAATPAPVARAWWESNAQDADGDRVDDAIDRLAPEVAVVMLAAFADVPTAADRAALREAGFELVQWYDHFDVVAVRALPADAARLLRVPGVVFVESDMPIDRLLKESVPLIGAPTVWKEFGATGKGVTIAVLDDGAFEQHPDFRGKVAGSFDAGAAETAGPLGQLSSNVPVVPAGEEGHGTHVAGTIVGPGSQSGGAYRGVAPDAAFVDVKVFRGPNQTSSSIVLRGMDWTMSNAERLKVRVLSMSLGGAPSDGKDALSRAVNVAVDDGFIVVAAAGNAGPAASTIGTPGAAEKAITVGAVDKKKALAKYSSRGPTKGGVAKPDIVAPGSSITSTIPPASTAAARNVVNRQVQTSAVYYGVLTGTSMAAPHVSGVVALMLQVDPDLTPLEVKQILIATAQDLGGKGRDNETGYGFVNAIAAVQVAEDPALLGSPQFAAILNTLPPPEEEDFFTRVQVEYESALRTGKIWSYAAFALGALVVILAVALVARGVRRRRLLKP